MIEFMNIHLVGGFNGIINGFFWWLIMVHHNKSESYSIKTNLVGGFNQPL